MKKKYHTVTPNEQIFTVIQKMNSHPFDAITVIDSTDQKNPWNGNWRKSNGIISKKRRKRW